MFRLKRSKADIVFSNYIRERDNWECQRCFTKYEPPTTALHCSHIFGRGNKSVRWDEDNAMALCHGCHAYFTANPWEHMNFAQNHLGRTRFDLLTLRAHTPKKVDPGAIVMVFEASLKRLRAEKEGIVYGKH